MKRALILLVVLSLTLVSTNLRADERGQVADDTLSAMGLSDMQVMSDEEGEEIRGQGAIAFGGSYAFFNGFFGGSGSLNAYGGIGSSVAGGQNLSFAGNFFGFGYFAGGSSSAYGF